MPRENIIPRSREEHLKELMLKVPTMGNQSATGEAISGVGIVRLNENEVESLCDSAMASQMS
jgi:hypothetical protein